MKKLTAIYRVERNGNMKHIVRDYHNSKKAFAKELRANGLRVVKVLSEKEIEAVLNKRYRLEAWEEYTEQVICGKGL